MLNKELDDFVCIQVSGKQEVALGLKKSFAGIQKSTLGPWSKPGQKTLTWKGPGSKRWPWGWAEVEIHQARIDFVFAVSHNGTVTYKPRRLPRHQRAHEHNSTPNSRQKIFM
jgi:hypothetical protein